MVRVFPQISPSLIETYWSEISPKITLWFCYCLVGNFIVPPIVVWIILVLHSNLVLILTINIWQNWDQLRLFWWKSQTNTPGYLRPITRVFPHHSLKNACWYRGHQNYKNLVFQGRPYLEKMKWDRTEMLFWLQEERKQQALEIESRIRQFGSPNIINTVQLDPIAIW